MRCLPPQQIQVDRSKRFDRGGILFKLHDKQCHFSIVMFPMHEYILLCTMPLTPPPPKKKTFLMVHPLMDDSQVGAENIGIHGPT